MAEININNTNTATLANTLKDHPSGTFSIRTKY